MSKLTPEQEAVAEELKEIAEKAKAVKLDIGIVVSADDGFFLIGSCCGPCTHALIHTAADYITDPRDPEPEIDVAVIVVQ